MTPPEVILDRFVRTRLRNEPGFSHYIGKLNIETVESPSFRSFLYLVQKTMNEELRSEGVNASGGVQHPPFRFDYLAVDAGIRNALAFQYGEFSFIVVTLPLVESVLHLSRRLSRSPTVVELLHLDPTTVAPDAFQGLLFGLQFSFLVSHEYTHHVHRHCAEGQGGVIGLWNEFPHYAMSGSLNSQAQELDADGYAAYLVLAHLLDGGMRSSALAELGRSDLQGTDGDELLLTCFFLAVLAFFCGFWHGDTDMASVYRFRRPLPPVRITYLIRVAEMWCRQNGSVPQSWFNPTRFQELFHAAAEVIEENARKTWDAQMSFLRGTDGVQYDQQLLERFEAVRRNGGRISTATA
jgi:hypothetical protein